MKSVRKNCKTTYFVLWVFLWMTQIAAVMLCGSYVIFWFGIIN